jgi:hypothetical protein
MPSWWTERAPAFGAFWYRRAPVTTGTSPCGSRPASYCMAAAAMQFQRHGWGNHVVRVWYGGSDQRRERRTAVAGGANGSFAIPRAARTGSS